jgi:hypothetical protein
MTVIRGEDILGNPLANGRGNYPISGEEGKDISRQPPRHADEVRVQLEITEAGFQLSPE